jgi:hypothetical protein
LLPPELIPIGLADEIPVGGLAFKRKGFSGGLWFDSCLGWSSSRPWA